VASDTGGDRVPAPAGGGDRLEREPTPVADLDRVAAVPDGQELQNPDGASADQLGRFGNPNTGKPHMLGGDTGGRGITL
jgi:hypothetical protein